MPLPETFQFSQSSLEDFTVCARRFELRYLQQLRWPAIEAEPVHEAERLAQLGADFHRLVQQHLIGLDESTLTKTLAGADPDLMSWWKNYLTYRPATLNEAQIHPELTLSAPLRGYRLLARFDVLAQQPDGTFLIIDWKTSRKKPSRDSLAARMQTRVYPYVLTAAGAAFNGGQSIDPAAVQMMYWYAHLPEKPELFEYSSALYQRDEQILSETIEQIKNAANNNHFPLVDAPKPCLSCTYRSFCERGHRAAPLADVDDAFPEKDAAPETLEPTALDWDQIAEIAF